MGGGRFDVSIAGELNLDMILSGLPREMPTERELIASEFSMTLGSSSAIFAHNLASLGMRVSFQGVIGDDLLGAVARKHLADAGVDVSGIKQLASRKTGVTVLLPHPPDRHILTYLGTIDSLTVADLDREQLHSARHFHLSSLYLQRGLHDGLVELLAELKRDNFTISLDPNDDPDDGWGAPLLDVLPFVDIFMPNESELCRMAKRDNLSAALQVMKPLVPVIVVKRGSLGALVVTHDSQVAVDALQLSHVVDTVGAGDSFNAGFVAAFLSGRDITTAAQCGNLAAALSTQGRGGIEAFTNAAIRDAFLTQHDPGKLLDFTAAGAE